MTQKVEQLIYSLQNYIPQTDDELWYWMKGTFGIEIPREKVCPDHVAPFTAFADAFFARNSLAVWKASRAFGGKSFLLAALTMAEAVALGASVNLLGGSGEQSKRVHRYMTGDDPNAKGKFWEHPQAPRYLLKDTLKSETGLTNGGYIKALMASQTSVRGPHPQRLRLDEIDEMSQAIYDAAQGQTMAVPGIPAQTVASSTHQHPNGVMTEAIRFAAEKGFPVYEWCYKETLAGNWGGWLLPSEVERKRREMSEAMWQVEVELQEPNPEGRAINSDAVNELFDRDLGVFKGSEGENIVIVPPNPRHEFYHGTDWAKAVDWTVNHTMLSSSQGPDKLAAWRRTGRRPWPQMIDLHNQRVKEYGGKSVHDVTGVGGVCADFLTVDSKGFDFSNRKLTHQILSDYVAAIENGDFIYPKIDFAHREHLYATIDMLYGSDHLPDSVCAGALAFYARKAIRETKVHSQRHF